MKNKKAQVATDTPIILSILAFQAFIILCLGFLTIITVSNNPDSISMNTSGITTNSPSNIFSFGNIITNIELLGWGNTLIFTPLGVCIAYIIAKLIRGGG